MQKELAQYLKYGRDQGATEIELFYVESNESAVEVRNQKLEKTHTAIDKGFAIRIIKDQKFGFSYTTSDQKEDILKAIDKAIIATEFTAGDKYLKLPMPGKQKVKSKLNNYDKKIEMLTTKERIAFAKEVEKAAFAYDKRITKTETASFSAGIQKTCLINSRGVFQQAKNSHCGIAIELVAEEGAHMEAGADYVYVTHLNDLNPVKVGETAAKKAVLMLGAGGIKTGDYDLLLEPSMGINFLSVIIPMFYASNIQRNKSMLKNKLQKEIASPKITLIDNPFLPKGLGSAFFDAEGVPTKQKTLIKNGILKSYLYDTYTANKDKTKSTGNAFRGSIKGEPYIGVSNLYLKPGMQSQKQLIKNIKRGILITNVMGLHTADTISGQFSFGATGQFIKNGKIIHSIKDMAIAGNLLDFMKHIKALGSDLEFLPNDGAIGSPSILVSNIKVAGNN